MAEDWKPETMTAFQHQLQKGFKGPFVYDDYGHIFDKDHNLVAQARGWGRLTNIMVHSDAIRLQRVIGGAMVALLNGKITEQ